jgi:hypothetical protein
MNTSRIFPHIVHGAAYLKYASEVGNVWENPSLLDLFTTYKLLVFIVEQFLFKYPRLNLIVYGLTSIRAAFMPAPYTVYVIDVL